MIVGSAKFLDVEDLVVQLHFDLILEGETRTVTFNKLSFYGIFEIFKKIYVEDSYPIITFERDFVFCRYINIYEELEKDPNCEFSGFTKIEDVAKKFPEKIGFRIESKVP